MIVLGRKEKKLVGVNSVKYHRLKMCSVGCQVEENIQQVRVISFINVDSLLVSFLYLRILSFSTPIEGKANKEKT